MKIVFIGIGIPIPVNQLDVIFLGEHIHNFLVWININPESAPKMAKLLDAKTTDALDLLSSEAKGKLFYFSFLTQIWARIVLVVLSSSALDFCKESLRSVMPDAHENISSSGQSHSVINICICLTFIFRTIFGQPSRGTVRGPHGVRIYARLCSQKLTGCNTKCDT